MIEVDRLEKHFGKHHEIKAVASATFRAENGEITGLLGPNGAGKTTLLRTLATLIAPDAGSASVDGQDVVRDRYAVRTRIGVLSDARGLYARLTARENVRYYGRLHGLGGAALDARVETLLSQFGLAALADRRAHGFSQGERMKVAIADLKSDNVLGVLPGSDPSLAGEHIVISAHLDGYGIGEPWSGDKIYNGAFDDAAYVATMIDRAVKEDQTF